MVLEHSDVHYDRKYKEYYEAKYFNGEVPQAQ